MDPCPFVRLIVESLSLKLPLATKHAGSSGIHPSTTPCFGKLKIKSFPSQTTLIPLSSSVTCPPDSPTSFTGFHLDIATFRRLFDKPITLNVSVYTGRMGSSCGLASGKLLGSVSVCVKANDVVSKPVVFQNGWMKLGSDLGSSSAKLHLVVRTEPDPRYVFQFGGEPECSPVVFQIQGNIRQPVFSCKFSADRNSRSRSLPSNFTTNTRVWMRTFSGDREKSGRERKGWMITIHDLSGSSVAAASMITPFVPSPGSDRVSRSNPGAWLILRPHGVSMKPWGRLEAWRERGSIDGLGYKFELVTSTGITSGIPIAQGTISLKNGGKFCIDTNRKDNAASSSSLFPDIRGFVMGSSVEGEGKVSKPVVQVGVKHVTCMTDAALFIALSAAIDLSMDACKLFSRKLRKEFWLNDHDTFS
ncbi:Formin-like protein 18 [Heracleum sosnowskyi]|uniref:Formin-like protein 18 n=1 Tax=Heracleum sosnowskyi TaxID=360622 RepID=A0AAD8MLF2_9APIA|nr:Formin-like protein 18 [Heracleum sosnowskyi]